LPGISGILEALLCPAVLEIQGVHEVFLE